MDFSRQLESLQQSANHAASSSGGGDEGGRNHHTRRRPRDNEGYSSNGRNYNNNHESYNGQHKRQRRDGRPSWDSRSHGYHQDRHYNNHNTHNSREISLRRALESIPPPRLLPANTVTTVRSGEGGQKRGRRHVALLFLTIDDLPHEHIWRAWINHQQNNNSNNKEDMLVSVLVHAKFPHLVKSPWLKSRLLLEPATPGRGRNSFGDPKFHSHQPEWGSVQITRGMIDLVDDALRIGIPDRMREEHRTDPRYSLHRFLATEDPTTKQENMHTTTASSTSTNGDMDMSFAVPPVDRFIFVSETCLPVTTLQEAEVALFGKTDDLHSSSIVKDQQDTEEQEVQANKGESEVVSKENALALPAQDSAVGTEETSAHAKDDVAAATTIGECCEKSWMFALNKPNNGYAKQLQWDRMDSAVQAKHIWKSDQWIVLTRPHAEAAAGIERYLPRGNNNEFWRCFGRVKASDEMYFPTCLSLLHILGNDNHGSEQKGDDRSVGSQILQRRVTYSDWSMGAKNPASFCSKGIRDLKDVATIARNQGCLFARKFSPIQEMEGAAASQSLSSRGTKTDGNNMTDPEVMSVEDWLGVIQGFQN